MLTRISFENSAGKALQVCIEPFAEYLDWGIGVKVELELELVNNKFNDLIEIAITDLGLIVYECRQFETRVFIDKELRYCTPKDRYS